MGKPVIAKKSAKAEKIEAKIRAAEKGMSEAKKKLAQLRKSSPRERVSDYALKTWKGDEIKLSKLFGKSNELIVIHNMGKQCPYCTLWADGFNGVWRHLNNRAPFVVVSPDSPAIQKKFATGRGWTFPMHSAYKTTFFRDMGYADEKGSPWPGISIFEKNADGTIDRVANSYFGPGDNFCVVWDIIDMIPKGQNGWQPKYKY